MQIHMGSLIIIVTLFLIPVHADPVFEVLDFDKLPYETLNRNGDFEEVKNDRLVGVQGYGNGYKVRTGEGRNASTAAFCDNPTGDKSLGLSWSFTISQTHPEPVTMSGWSRAENVEGSMDSDYSLYIDVIYTDGTPSWGHQVQFSTGTHDWQELKLLVIPEKEIRQISCYALFRYKKGSVWFDDITIQKSVLRTGMLRLDGLSVQTQGTIHPSDTTQKLKTETMAVEMEPTSGAIVSLRINDKERILADTAAGFLVRDVSAHSGYYAFQDGQCEPLSCKLNINIQETDSAIQIKGNLVDLIGKPRAMNLLYAIPVDVLGGQWGDHLSESSPLSDPDEYHSWIQIGTGSNGQMSRYPFACISHDNFGLALGIDMGMPCQWRLGYSTGTRLFYLSLDFGLSPLTKNFPSQANFQMVMYAIDPQWSFRSAAERYYQIFPDYFAVRSPDQGIWMPFTDVSTVQGWQDFGFKYHEGNNNVPFDDSANVLSFRYSEPSTWWMNMDTSIPRTYAAAMEQVQTYAESSSNSSLQRNAQALLTSGSFDEQGKYQMLFRDEPWANGAVFSLNPSPFLPGEYTDASLMWNDSLAERLYGTNSKGVMDGEYLDSLEGYVTADLNFRTDHFEYATTPLTFTMDAYRPVIYKAFSIYEFTRYMSEQMHSRGKLLFANGVPYRYSFLCPWLDILGTETNWISGGSFSPDSVETMNYRKTLSGKKPYLFLMNTNFDEMSSAIVELYFQRCLFYGMYPSMFSHNAAENPYWQNPTLYNRDRPLFVKYQPLIRQVAEAGWEPVTWIRTNDEKVLVERYGQLKDDEIFLTVYGMGNASTSFHLQGEDRLQKQGHWQELLSEKEGDWNGGLDATIDKNTVQIYRITDLAKDSSIPDAKLN